MVQDLRIEGSFDYAAKTAAPLRTWLSKQSAMNKQPPFTRPHAFENRKLWIFAFRFAICVFQLSICNFLIFSDGWSADRSAAPRIAPTIARLSFWLSPDRFSEFETTYREKLVPILKKHGLEESSERGRATIDGVFSRLFEVRAPSEIPERNNALRNDTAWTAILKALGESFGTNRNDGTIRHSLHLYAAPGAPPRVVSAGTGKMDGYPIFRTGLRANLG